ncbi:MAG: IS256 family transposase [Arenicellales bacterium]|jgi:transposase-like protein|nr:IS256 family transposase [Arenicellales bacterium]|tara:strand:+ start:99 stop:1379 length:1281 start_codon:yes stop_codon:yes gene_type:complete
MSKDTTTQAPNPEDGRRDDLTDLLREGAKRLIAEAVEAEVSATLSEFADYKDDAGHRHVVRNGYLPEREIMTGLGPVSVQVPKVRDRSGAGIKFTSAILPPYLRRARSVEEVLPWLYLKGISTGDMQEALEALLGPEAKGLSPASISRLKARWEDDHQAWSGRDLSDKRYVYFWIDGVYFNVRMDEAKQCILVIIGVTEDGVKEFVAIDDGYRESEQSWLMALRDLKQRGLQIGPELAVGDGALGFWKALPKVYGQTRSQRCWVHKTKNVLNCLPKGLQAKAKAALQQIWMAPSREQAHKAFDRFVTMYQAKYPKAAECLQKDREALLAFYDFPAEHWIHIRTTNPVESTFATVRLRTAKTRGCVSRSTILALVFRLGLSAEKRWIKLKGFQRLGQVIRGVKFSDGVPIPTDQEGVEDGMISRSAA